MPTRLFSPKIYTSSSSMSWGHCKSVALNKCCQVALTASWRATRSPWLPLLVQLFDVLGSLRNGLLNRTSHRPLLQSLLKLHVDGKSFLASASSMSFNGKSLIFNLVICVSLSCASSRCACPRYPAPMPARRRQLPSPPCS